MFRCWPNSDVKVLKRIAVVCRSDRTIRRSAVQSFAGVWPFPSRLQRGVHSARPEKVDSWLHRCWLVPTHFQPVSAFKAAGTPRGPSTNGLPDVRRSSSAITVRLPAGSFYWICRAMHPIWNSPRGRPWWLPLSFWTSRRPLTRSSTTSSIQRLETSFGSLSRWRRLGMVLVVGLPSARTQFVRCTALRSSAVPLVRGVPQGSVLGPVLLILYVADLPALIYKNWRSMTTKVVEAYVTVLTARLSQCTYDC